MTEMPDLRQASSAVLIGVDWGTSNCRAYLIDADGQVLRQAGNARGILAVAAGGFLDALRASIAELDPPRPLPPLLMSGMIGSRQGWVEAPYADCPAGVTQLGRSILRFEAGEFGSVGLVPGLHFVDVAGIPDVMRGEETQIVGTVAATGGADGLFVLPGTHSKWARVENGRILSFATYMTGEVFAVLRDHSILGRLMEGAKGTGKGFQRGIAMSKNLSHGGDLLHALFSARTLGLFGKVPATELADYLSGLLIGAEFRAAMRGDHPVARIHIIANSVLTRLYSEAASMLGIEAIAAPADAIAQGYLAIAREAGMITGVAA